MAYKYKVDMAHRSNYGSWRDLSAIEYIAIHYTANDGDTDENNGDYFNGANRKASAHLFVDDDSVTQSVPFEYAAWHCGGGLQGSGGHTFYGKCTNANSIGIEICDDVKNGTIYPSAKTIENVIELTKSLMKQFNIDADHVIRHYDVTGKLCPAYWCGSVEKDKKWKTEFHNKLKEVNNINASIQANSGASYTRMIFEEQGEFFRIKDKEHGYFLTASANAKDAGVEFTKADKGNLQLWKLIKKQYKNADYTMLECKGAPELFLSVENNGIGSSELKLWTDLHNQKQKFYIREESDGTTLIIHTFTGKVVSCK